MIKTYTIEPDQNPTEEMLKEVEEASRRPVVSDEDCPERSERMIKVLRVL